MMTAVVNDETTEAALFRRAEQLQGEAKTIMAMATNLYHAAGEIKQLTISLASNKISEIDNQ
jgi:hypothetical protein